MNIAEAFVFVVKNAPHSPHVQMQKGARGHNTDCHSISRPFLHQVRTSSFLFHSEYLTTFSFLPCQSSSCLAYQPWTSQYHRAMRKCQNASPPSRLACSLSHVLCSSLTGYEIADKLGRKQMKMFQASGWGCHGTNKCAAQGCDEREQGKVWGTRMKWKVAETRIKDDGRGKQRRKVGEGRGERESRTRDGMESRKTSTQSSLDIQMKRREKGHEKQVVHVRR